MGGLNYVCKSGAFQEDSPILYYIILGVELN